MDKLRKALLDALNEQIYLYQLICTFKNNFEEFGEIFEPETFEYFMSEYEKADTKRKEILEKLGYSNKSASFLEDITFKDNGKIVEGQLFKPLEGALDFVKEFQNSDDLFMLEVATYVAACL